MRQEISAGKPGIKTVWDDPVKLQALYAEFGEGPEGEKRFNELLDKLSLAGDWGGRAAMIIKARRDGNSLDNIAAVLGLSHASAVQAAENRALQMLRELRDREEMLVLPRIGEGPGRPTIWNNPHSIMMKYGGKAHFEELLGQLADIETDYAPGWGRRLVEILQRLLLGDLQIDIAIDFDYSPESARRISSLGYEALAALDALEAGEAVTPPKPVGVNKKEEWREKMLQRYGSEDNFWRLVQQFENVFWNILKEKGLVGSANRIAQGLAVLRGHVRGLTGEDIGRILGGENKPLSKQRIEQIEAWVLANLDRLQRGEEVRLKELRSWPEEE